MGLRALQHNQTKSNSESHNVQKKTNKRKKKRKKKPVYQRVSVPLFSPEEGGRAPGSSGRVRLLSELRPTPPVLRETVKGESPLVYLYGNAVRKPVLRELSANTSTAERTVGMFSDKPRAPPKVAAGCWVLLLSLRECFTLLSNPYLHSAERAVSACRCVRDSAGETHVAVPLPGALFLAFGRSSGPRRPVSPPPPPPATGGEPRLPAASSNCRRSAEP